MEEHFKNLQKICDPIIAKVYQASGGQGGADGGAETRYHIDDVKITGM